MKHLKYFEDTTEDKPTKPQIEDYVTINPNSAKDPDIKEFLSNKIGQIINIENSETNDIPMYKVYYKNIPDSMKNQDKRKGLYNIFYNNCWSISQKDILQIAPTKKDLKIKLQANKFNL